MGAASVVSGHRRPVVQPPWAVAARAAKAFFCGQTDTVSGSDHRPPALDRPHEPLARYAGLTGVATLTSRLLGLARDQVLAAFFGAGNDMDAFVVAFRIPNLLRDLVCEGAMSAAFVPTF